MRLISKRARRAQISRLEEALNIADIAVAKTHSALAWEYYSYPRSKSRAAIRKELSIARNKSMLEYEQALIRLLNAQMMLKYES